MSVLEVLKYPDERLRQKSKEVTDFGPQTQTMIDDMLDTLAASENCAGYSAIQMNLPYRITVIAGDIAGAATPVVLVNPEIIDQRGETYTPEGCMSIPEVFASVKRAEWVSVKAKDRHGNDIHVETDEFYSKCLQHEIDHMNGVLFIDYLSPLKRKRLDKKLKKQGLQIDV